MITQAEAENQYYAAEELRCTAFNELAEISDPLHRSRLLTTMAEANYSKATLYPTAFNVDPDVVTGPESIRYEALLYGLLADVEQAVGTGTPRQVTSTELEPAAGEVLDRMATDGDLQWRARMLEPLYDAVIDIVGGTAAEELWYMQSPGYVGWMTIAERSAYNTANRRRRFMRVAALALAVPAAVLCVVAVASWRRRRRR